MTNTQDDGPRTPEEIAELFTIAGRETEAIQRLTGCVEQLHEVQAAKREPASSPRPRSAPPWSAAGQGWGRPSEHPGHDPAGRRRRAQAGLARGDRRAEARHAFGRVMDASSVGERCVPLPWTSVMRAAGGLARAGE